MKFLLTLSALPFPRRPATSSHKARRRHPPCAFLIDIKKQQRELPQRVPLSLSLRSIIFLRESRPSRRDPRTGPAAAAEIFSFSELPVEVSSISAILYIYRDRSGRAPRVMRALTRSAFGKIRDGESLKEQLP